jgi:hypothetical protein
MNNLKKYVGLLNDIAPKGEFLAYINKDEAEMLKDNGALGLLTPQGIPSYRGAGAYQGGSGAPGSAESSSSSSSSSSSATMEETLAVVVVAVVEEVVKVIHPHLHLHQY